MGRRVLTAVGIAVALALGPGRATSSAYSSSSWYEGADGWTKARRAQRAHGIPIFLFFTAEWCAACHALEEVLEEPQVRERMRGLIIAEDFGGSGFPTLFRVSPGGARRRISAGPAARLLRQLP